MPLTDTAIRRAKAQEKPYKLADMQGLYVYITPSGARSWRLKYRHRGTERTLTLGLYPDVPLTLAREKRNAARKLLAAGIDPNEQRRAEEAASVHTFRAVADEWMGKQSKVLASETMSLMSGRLALLNTALGSKAIDEIKAPDLLAVLRRLESRGTVETAHRTRSLYGRIARYAISIGAAERDVSQDLRGALTPVKATHFASLTEPKRIGELLRAIQGYQGQPAVEYALKLAPYLFVRPGELRGAEWSEFDLDAEHPLWRIPAEKTKMGREHLVPLATQVVALLKELQAHTGDARLLFPGLRSAARPISDNTMNAALRRLGYDGTQMTSHGFRSMASTLLNEQGFAPDVVELQLGHAEQNKTRAAYNKALRMPERRKMMTAWASYLDGLKAGASVTPIGRARA